MLCPPEEGISSGGNFFGITFHVDNPRKNVDNPGITFFVYAYIPGVLWPVFSTGRGRGGVWTVWKTQKRRKNMWGEAIPDNRRLIFL